VNYVSNKASMLKSRVTALRTMSVRYYLVHRRRHGPRGQEAREREQHYGAEAENETLKFGLETTLASRT